MKTPQIRMEVSDGTLLVNRITRLVRHAEEAIQAGNDSKLVLAELEKSVQRISKLALAVYYSGTSVITSDEKAVA